MPRAPLRVWVLSDNQPGHYNQSRGIVAALRLHQPVEEHWLGVRLRVGLARNPMRWLLNHCSAAPSARWLNLFYRMPPLPPGACDLLVSTGGKTSFANAWLAQRLRTRNVFAGSLRRLSPDLFDVVLTLEPLAPPVPTNLVVDLPPSSIDASQLAHAAQALRAAHRLEGQTLWTLMLGGDGAGYRYGEQDWRQLARLLNQLGAAYGVRWLLLSSRRTGRVAERLIEQGMDSERVAARCWYRPGEASRVEAYLGAADRVFVSEDSMTMLTEAICSQRPVVSLRPVAVAPTPRYAAMLERFATRGWICRYAIDDLVAGRQSLGDTQCRVLETPPLQQLSAQLAERLQL
jgi:mitochondrial fission protein ELM1